MKVPEVYIPFHSPLYFNVLGPHQLCLGLNLLWTAIVWGINLDFHQLSVFKLREIVSWD